MNREEVKFNFDRDVANHKITVIQNDGVNRVLRFSRPGSSAYYFDIVTWAGKLCISGDMGTHVFARLHDMFEFFRTDKDINPGYWAEKLVTDRDCIWELDEDHFKKIINDRKNDFIEEHDLNEDEIEELEAELEHLTNVAKLDEAYAALYNFNFEIVRYNDGYGKSTIQREVLNLSFDMWECDLREENYHFLWNLYAIKWAIQKYDDWRHEKSQEEGFT